MRSILLVIGMILSPAAPAIQVLMPQDIDDAPSGAPPPPRAPRVTPVPVTPAPRREPVTPPRPVPNARTEATTGPCAKCGPNATLKKHADEVRVATVGCDMKRVTARARQIGAGTSSGGLCLPAVRRAFQEAGCAVPAGFAMNAVQAFRALQNVWRCQGGGTAAAAPDGAVIFSVGCGSHHTEIKSNNCYYSDFHHRDCLASSQYAGCPYRQIGWCKP